MADEQYTVWLNTRKAEALAPLLAAKGMDIEQAAQGLLDLMYQQEVPLEKQSEVDGLIEQDRQHSEEMERQQAEEAWRNKQVGVFSVTENDVTQHFVCDFYNRPAILASKCWTAMKDIDAQRANTLTACAFGVRESIGSEAFENLLANPGAGPQVAASAAIDFDSGIFALRQDGQWVAYNLQIAGRTGAAVLRMTAHTKQYQDAEFLSRLDSHVLEVETLALGPDGIIDHNRLEHLLDAQLLHDVNALEDGKQPGEIDPEYLADEMLIHDVNALLESETPEQEESPGQGLQMG